MKINAKKRFLSYILAFLMVFTYIPAAAYATDTDNTTGNTDTSIAEAGSGVIVLDGQIRVEDDLGNAIKLGSRVVITGPGDKNRPPVQNNIRIYNEFEKALILSLDYTAENYGAFSESKPGDIINNVGNSTGSFTTVIDPGKSIDMYIKGLYQSGSNTATLTLTNFICEPVADSSVITVNYDETIGTVNVDGNKVVAGGSTSVSYANGGIMVAEPNEGVRFAGWMNPETNEVYSRDLSYTIRPTENVTVEAVFMGTETDAYYLVGNKYLVIGFNQAMEKVKDVATKTVVLLKDDTLARGTYVVPDGVTLLIPFDRNNTLYTDKPEGVQAVKTEPDIPTAFCTLTLAEGADLVVNGSLSLSAKHNAANGGWRAAGMPIGEISYLVTEKNSAVTVNDGGALYAYGYIIGEGAVTAKSGAIVYENFQIEDFKGGEVTMNVAFHEMEKGVLPISQYYVQNIEVPLTLEAGAKEFVYTSLYTNNNVYGAGVPFMGDENSMFDLLEGTAVKTYDRSTDRLVFDVDGDMKLSPINISLAGNEIDSSMFDLPINSNITVNLNGGSTTINQDVALLPGAEINIAEGTTCTLAEKINVFVYDADQWDGYVGLENKNMIPLYYSPSRPNAGMRTEADLEDAAIRVNGTFDVSKGFLFTTTSEDKKGGGANVYSTANGKVITTTGAAPKTYQYKHNNDGGAFDLINLLPVNLKNGDGSYIQTLETGVGTYTYEAGKWVCGHEIYKEDVIKEATCQEEGEKIVTCVMEEVEAGFGHKYNVIIPKADHTPVIDKAEPPTCTEPGLKEGSHCDVCGETIVEREVDPALGHKWEADKSFDKEPTCTEDGTRSTHCERCGVVKEGSEESVKTPGHTYKYDVVEATCLEEGKQTKYCTKCDIPAEIEVLEALGHNYKHFITDPTCTEEGYTSHICSRCDDEYKDEITPAVSHSISAVEKKEPECTVDGHKAHYKCDQCEGLFSDEEGTETINERDIKIDALDHKYGDWITDEEPTCTDRGSKHRDCSRCDDVDKEFLYPVGHTEALDEEVDATCHKTGLTAGLHCTVCGEELIKQEIIPKLEHVVVKDKAVEATCTKTGLTEGSHCRLCGDVIVAQEEVEKKDHTTVVDAAVEATCTKDGLTEGSHCKVCKEVLVEQTVVNKLGHNSVVDSAEEPTCTKTGLTEGSHCDVCGEVLVEQEIVDILGHDFEHFDGKEATCTEKGYEPYDICKRCDYNSYKEIPAKEHDIKKHIEEATCTEDGYTVEYCNCGYENIIPGDKATGHSFTKYAESVHATCEKVGKEKAVCDNGCGAVDVRDTALADHTPVIDPAVASTCTKEGLTEGSHCSVCEEVIVEQKPVAMKPHDTIKHEAKAATCLDKGHEAYETCKDCDYTTFKETDPLDHDLIAHEAKEPTCTEIGWDAYETCSRCDHTTYSEKSIADHKYGEEQFKTPTATEDGGYYEVCSVCGDTKWNKEQTYAEYIEEGVAGTTIEVTAEGSVKTEQITLKWTKTGSFGLSYYNVYRSTTKDGTFTYIGKSKSTSYIDKKATVGKTYYYKVAGRRLQGEDVLKTKTSDVVSAKIKKVTSTEVKATPMNAKTNYVNKGLQITWTSPKIKVDGYEVFRKTPTGKTFKLLKRTGPNVYTCTNTGLKVGKKYSYKVRGYKKVNGKTVYTKFSSVGYRYVQSGTAAKQARAIVRADAVTAKSAVKVSGGIKVTWSKKASIKTNMYSVWRATSKNGTYTRIATTKNSYYTDKKAKSGKTYYYKIRGYRYFGKSAASTNFSNIVSGKR